MRSRSWSCGSRVRRCGSFGSAAVLQLASHELQAMVAALHNRMNALARPRDVGDVLLALYHTTQTKPGAGANADTT